MADPIRSAALIVADLTPLLTEAVARLVLDEVGPAGVSEGHSVLTAVEFIYGKDAPALKAIAVAGTEAGVVERLANLGE